MKEVKRQVIPTDLLNTRWKLERWNGQAPDCTLTMNFYPKGRFAFTWNNMNFAGDHLWYMVKDSTITFQTGPMEKIVWTTEQSELKPDNFALHLKAIKNYRIDSGRLMLKATDKVFSFSPDK